MKHLRHIIANLAGLIFLLFASISCQLVFDPVDNQDVESSDMTFLTFEMNLPTLPNSTKTPAGDYDPGSTELENYIRYDNNLRFYIFDASPAPIYIGSVSQQYTYVEGISSTNTNYKKYFVRILLSPSITSTLFSTGTAPNFRILAMANCNNYPEPDSNGRLTYNGETITTLEQFVDKMRFSLTAPLTQLDMDHLIPMFGIKQCSGVNFKKGIVNNIGTLHMLRALAKVDICVSDKEFADLESVTLHNYNLSGLCAPRNVVSQEDYVHNSYKDDYVNHISLINNVNESGHPAFEVTPTSTVQYGASVTRNVHTVYIPEYQNRRNVEGTIVPTEDKSYFTLKFNDGDTNEYTLNFKYYDSAAASAANVAVGTYFNVSRNNYYKFTVRRTYDLVATVEVVPYKGVVLTPGFGFDEYLPQIVE